MHHCNAGAKIEELLPRINVSVAQISGDRNQPIVVVSASTVPLVTARYSRPSGETSERACLNSLADPVPGAQHG